LLISCVFSVNALQHHMDVLTDISKQNSLNVQMLTEITKQNNIMIKTMMGRHDKPDDISEHFTIPFTSIAQLDVADRTEARKKKVGPHGKL